MKEAEFSKKVKESDGKEKIKALVHYSEYLRQSEPEKSSELALEALELARKLNDEILEAAALSSLAHSYFYKSDFVECQRLINQMLQLGMKTNHHATMANAYNLKGRIAFKTRNPALGKEHYLKALDYYLKNPDPRNLMSCYNNLGQIYQHQGNNEEALNYFKMSLEEANKINHSAANIIRQNIATINFTKGKYNEALEDFIIAAEYFEQHKLDVNLSNAYYNIGITYKELENYPKTLEYCTRSYEMKKKGNDPKGLSYTCATLAHVLIAIGEFEKAKDYIEQSIKIAEDNDLKWNQYIAIEALTHYLEENGDYKEALEQCKKMILIKEELNNEINQKNLSELETKYKTKMYKLKTQELNAQNKSMNEQIKTLLSSLAEQRELYNKLEKEFQASANRINEQDDVLSTQSRMATMGEMISLIAHQWRQPLNVIGVMVQSFQDAWEFDELTGEFIDQQVDIVMNQIQYMSDTITDFRDFFKPEMAQIFDIREAINKAIHLLGYVFKKYEIKLEKHLEEGCLLNGVPNDLVQVFLNIINNAQQAMRTAEIEYPMVRISMKKAQDNVVIKLFNIGTKIEDDNIDKLFEPYFTSKGENGTGIGLYICRKIIENKYQGSITANNTDSGVEFIITLPCVTEI